jgi:hypothetical protein
VISLCDLYSSNVFCTYNVNVSVIVSISVGVNVNVNVNVNVSVSISINDGVSFRVCGRVEVKRKVSILLYFVVLYEIEIEIENRK